MSMGAIREEARAIPIIGRYDVLVVGGGSAGWAAAIAARRCGAMTLLIDRESYLGGTATASMMNLFGEPYECTQGLMREVIDMLAATGEAIPGPLTPFDGEALKRILFAMIKAEGVELLLDTWFARAIVEDNAVTGVIIENKNGRQAVMAKAVIDASGDGDVAASAGASFILGRETDGRMRPVTLLFRIGNVNVKKLLNWVERNPDQFKNDSNSHIINHKTGQYRLHGFFDIMAAGRDRGEVDENCHYLRFEYVSPQRGIALVNTTRVYNINSLRAEDTTRAMMEAYEQVQKLVRYIKANIPGCEDIFLIDTAPRLGIRETRHIVGDYTVVEDDLVADRAFPDAIIRDYRRMVPGAEVHSPDGKEGTMADRLERAEARKLFSYRVPFRCMLPRGLERILVAGRCISATHQADGWLRDIPGCFLVGQAAGVAAAIAAAKGTTPRQVDLAVVRKELEKQGVSLTQREVILNK